MNLSDQREHMQWKQPAVLLIDGDPERQAQRAASLRRSGMMVVCAANGASAAALWEPEKYQLVLIEMFEADTDVRPFCEKLQALSPRQKVGIYCPEHPFILYAGKALLRPDVEPPRALRSEALRGDIQQEAPAAAGPQNGTSGIVEAARRIAALRRRVPIYVKPPRREEQPQPKPESHASVAARVLGGEL